MAPPDEEQVNSHTKLILARYADRANINPLRTDEDTLIERYLSKVMSTEEIRDKTIVELGAGCSQYVPLFLDRGCKNYFANDIIPERLAAIRTDDPRYHEIPGDFRVIQIPEAADIVFANLVMMMIMPMLDEFIERIRGSLRPGGTFFSMDANYLCPLSIYRRYADRTPNPVRLFSPFSYADKFRRQGFEVEKLVPFTAPAPWVTGNWLLGTTFWLRARKQ